MALLKGSLFAGALFAGSLVGGTAVIVVPPIVVVPRPIPGMVRIPLPHVDDNQKIRNNNAILLAILMK